MSRPVCGARFPWPPAWGVRRSQLILDPGIGFGKTYAQDYELIARLPESRWLGFPLLVGTSRKKFIGRVLDGCARPGAGFWHRRRPLPPAFLNGAHIVRVHDVAEMVQVARVTDAVLCPSSVAKTPEVTHERSRGSNFDRSRQLPKCLSGGLFRMDVRRVRFFHPDVCSGSGGAGFSQADFRSRLHSHRQPHHAPRRGFRLRLDGGPLRHGASR